jgi:glycosyltransferase involved in cell wall biosynthesis
VVTKLSVVVPYYNVRRYLEENLSSLAQNASPEIEFVLVDDGSTDDTGARLAEAADELRGSTLVSLPCNGGLSAARNAGLTAARGRYLTFLDGDDVAAPGHFAALIAAMDHLGCDFVRTGHVRLEGRQRTVQHVAHAPRGVPCPARTGIGAADRRSSVDSPHAWAGVYDRRLLERGLLWFDEDLRTCEDRPWIWRLHLRARSFAAVGLRGVRYRCGVPGSLTQLTDERQLAFLPACERIVTQVLDDQDAEFLLPKALRTYCALLAHHLHEQRRYPAPLRARLLASAAASIDRLPQRALRATVASLDPARADALRSLVPAW